MVRTTYSTPLQCFFQWHPEDYRTRHVVIKPSKEVQELCRLNSLQSKNHVCVCYRGMNEVYSGLWFHHFLMDHFDYSTERATDVLGATEELFTIRAITEPCDDVEDAIPDAKEDHVINEDCCSQCKNGCDCQHLDEEAAIAALCVEAEMLTNDARFKALARSAAASEYKAKHCLPPIETLRSAINKTLRNPISKPRVTGTMPTGGWYHHDNDDDTRSVVVPPTRMIID